MDAEQGQLPSQQESPSPSPIRQDVIHAHQTLSPPSSSSKHNGQQQQQQPTQEDYQLFENDPRLPHNLMNTQHSHDKDNKENNADDDSLEPLYIVKQKRGYLSILFSLTQTLVLLTMMYQCSIAPLNINPMVGPNPDALSYWGGKNSYLILYENEYWRMVTPILLHAGILHLFCNVSVQLDTGAFFEKEWGSFIWLIIYLGSAIGGSLLSIVVSPNSIGVGSSGSVCGLFGGKLAEVFCRCCESQKTEYAKLKHRVLMEHFASTSCSVILVLVFSFIPYVDWAAHVGGLIAGFTIGMMCFALQIKTVRWRIIWFLVGTTLTTLLMATTIGYCFEVVKNDVAKDLEDVCAYYQQYFAEYECNCQLEEEK